MNRRKGVIVSKTEEKLVNALRHSCDYIKSLNKHLEKANGYGSHNLEFKHEDYGFNYMDKAVLISEEEFNREFSIKLNLKKEGYNKADMYLTGQGCNGIDFYDKYLEFVKANFSNEVEVQGSVIMHGSPYLNVVTDKDNFRYITLPLELFEEYKYMKREGKKLIIIN